MARTTKPCDVPLTRDRYGEPEQDGPRCSYPRKAGKVKCRWHWLLRQPIEAQVRDAEVRERSPFFGQPRKTVPEREWPEGERWCSGCQHFVPLFYTTGSRCKACASRAAHASHVRRTYGLEPEEYQALLEWQGGRCFICGQVPRVRRLAVDHDHVTGAVRGLLCANDEFGCNVQLRRLLNDVDMARRALEYVEVNPLLRMRGGEPARSAPRRPRPSYMGSAGGQDVVSGPAPVPLERWDPWAADGPHRAA